MAVFAYTFRPVVVRKSESMATGRAFASAFETRMKTVACVVVEADAPVRPAQLDC